MGSKKTNSYHLIAAQDMAGVISSSIQNVSNFDNIGLQVTWTGTPTGIIQVLGSVDGVTFYALTFNPVLTQPAGSAGGYLIDLNQFPWPFLQVTYAQTSGAGTLDVWLNSKDLN
jgi:hypothetical protein